MFDKGIDQKLLIWINDSHSCCLFNACALSNYKDEIQKRTDDPLRFPVSGTTGSSGMRRGTTTEYSTDGMCLCTPHKIK
jgi:hypothetical protein